MQETTGISGGFAALVATVPILWLFVSLGAMKMAAPKATLSALALSLALAIPIWAMPPVLAAKAVLDGAVFAFVPIIWVILAAVLTYSIAVETKAIDSIKALLASITEDRRLQALIIAWGFGGFLESVAGFGTAVVVPAALLISLGFQPFQAAVICLLANTVAVAFGVVGIPITTLAWITDLPVTDLSTAVVLQLTPFVICVPAFIVMAVTCNVRDMLGALPHALAAGVSFGVVQFFAARYIGPELPAILGSLSAFGVGIFMAKRFPPAQRYDFPGEQAGRGTATPVASVRAGDQLKAWSPYISLLVLVLCTSRLFPPVNGLLATVKSSWLIYDGPGGKPFTIAWLLTPGTLVMASAVLGGRIQGAPLAAIGTLAVRTFRQLGKSIVTIVSIVALAKVLSYSGMVDAIAVATASATGAVYPLAAPVLGMLGTFITGSDTSSNILFGQLQKQVALSIGASPVWIAASNTSGACIGKLISLQSIAIASIAANLTGREGELLFTTLRYALGFTLVLGGVVFLFG